MTHRIDCDMDEDCMCGVRAWETDRRPLWVRALENRDRYGFPPDPKRMTPGVPMSTWDAYRVTKGPWEP